jgi:dephospho-CoA kinase
MIVLGLTGSIGMGKSTAAKMLGQMGAASHDSDAVARAVIGPGGDAVAAVAALFPEAYDRKNNAIDRAKLGPIVFADPAKKKQLEEIVHPLVQGAQQKFLRDQKALGARFAVLDIPLLYETGGETRVDKVIVVSCPAFIQRRRVLARHGMSAEKFDNIVKSQMPDHEKRRRADFVVQTGLGMAFTYRSLKRILQQLSQHHDQDRNHFPPLSP